MTNEKETILGLMRTSPPPFPEKVSLHPWIDVLQTKFGKDAMLLDSQKWGIFPE